MRLLADIVVAIVFIAECAVIGGSLTMFAAGLWVSWFGVPPLFLFCVGALTGVLYAILDMFDEFDPV
jgi:hypothetical protein